MEKVFVAKKVATKLYATEAALDAAMTEAAEMIAEMVKARAELGLSAVVGDQAQAKIVEAIAALGEARTAVVAAHADLDEVRRRIGVRTKGLGFLDKPAAQATESVELREVG